ncbi:molybdenum ABC transporter permease subunit [Rhodobacter veldkampii DSM 11550]|uniref:Molybdenum transport system permease n=1 Tax=Phaeovulum veldkampii DSM 11550 TaxID=1185920 RepID=A0A2T4JLW2_9RHOB|nr:molybdate ABC transporter permease subunit [Phaeovulum veldkampii]MBK5945984.1 molybdenum ABC transporter permease subunit [Phaeovulum veldkampii DSM 11550]NCU20122.1 molybdate ABC transporter permease subunit [Candidatus Falkowbacteria bacterium]PTE18895.1 molybdate ABC transporter permease subunit [Phaeovulum veldkampii DSM 11550]TDQ64620.1 molybdate transport system permease protein [Phaeovulum veldkampii DSM 11550]
MSAGAPLFDAAMIQTILLTLKLAGITTVVLLLVGTPLAWVLARGRGFWNDVLGSLVSLPIVLPPTVLGFYLLIAMGPQSPLTAILGHKLSFTFTGLVVGSVVYSLPFVVNPIRNSFQAMGNRPWEVAATLRASPLDAFFTVALPLARPGILTGAIMGFAHTVGEFGVVLMIGGGIPGQTKVLSVTIFDYVETLQWGKAHILAGGMLAMSFAVILVMLLIERRLDGGRR